MRSESRELKQTKQCVYFLSLSILLFPYVLHQVNAVENRCLELIARDYKYSVIHNANGEVCGHYPRQIVFLEYESTDPDSNR